MPLTSYNNNVGNVDQADQYYYDTNWHYNRKLFQLIWWWGIQIFLNNSYVLSSKIIYCMTATTMSLTTNFSSFLLGFTKKRIKVKELHKHYEEKKSNG